MTSKKTTKSVGRSTKRFGGSGAGWEGIFASPTLARLLSVLFTSPDREFYQRELMDASGAKMYSVQREMARLEKMGLVFRTPRGNRVYYRANRSHPAFEDLKRVVLKTIGLGDALRVAVAPLASKVQVAFVFGSFAKGEETATSDVDILLIGDLSLRELSSVLGPISHEMGREFNPVIYSPAEFKERLADGHHFLTEVLKSEVLFLIGDKSALEGITG